MSDTKDDKQKRKRKPARFVIQTTYGDKVDESWQDKIIPADADPPDSTEACMKLIEKEKWTGVFRITQVKKTFEVKVEQTPTTTITDIE